MLIAASALVKICARALGAWVELNPSVAARANLSKRRKRRRIKLSAGRVEDMKSGRCGSEVPEPEVLTYKVFCGESEDDAWRSPTWLVSLICGACLGVFAGVTFWILDFKLPAIILAFYLCWLIGALVMTLWFLGRSHIGKFSDGEGRID
jgi:hypothetical protein